MCTPANTPATPPNFPDALTMFSRLKASESFNSGSGGSPMAAAMATSPPPHQVGGWGVSSNVPNVPQPPQGLWTQGQPPTQPCPAWPTGVNPHTGAEQKASVAMEAERWRPHGTEEPAPPPTLPCWRGEGNGKWMWEGGEGGKWLEVGLGFPPTSQKTKQNKKNWWYWKRQILRKPRKTQRGQFEEEKTNANVNTEKKE